MLADSIPAALDRLADAPALVVDLRRNGGGSSWLGYLLLDRLAEAPYVPMRSWAREDVGLYQAWGRVPRTVPVDVPARAPDTTAHYGGPVAVLIGPATFSAAEDVAVAFDAMGRGVLVGEPTGGSTGQPLSFALPGGGSARVRVKHDAYPDGTEFIGVGVRPDVAVRPTLADLRAGRDPALEAAVEVVRAARSSRGSER